MSLSERGRFSSKRKREAVLRLLRGEDLDLLSRELGVTGAAKLWGTPTPARSMPGSPSSATSRRGRSPRSSSCQFLTPPGPSSASHTTAELAPRRCQI